MAPSPYIFIISIGPVDVNKYARFDKIPSKTFKDIKETKRYGRTDGQTDNVKTVYPPTNTVCAGYNNFWKSGDQKLLTDLCVLILRDSLDLKLRYCKLDSL